MPDNIYCDQCGGPIGQDQKFCERCGTRLFTAHDSLIAPKTPHHSENILASEKVPIGLLDPVQMNYVIEEKFWECGSRTIYNESGQPIGKVNRKLLPIREIIELRELDERVVASIYRKLVAIRPTYILKDENEQILGHFEKTLLNILHPKFNLKNPSGDIILTAQGKLMGFDFMIFQGEILKSTNIVAEIHKADRWNDIFFSGAWDFKDTYGIRVIQPDIDRRLVLGFVIAIDNMIHDF
jgi:uncharacterized protein YxjI